MAGKWRHLCHYELPHKEKEISKNDTRIPQWKTNTQDQMQQLTTYSLLQLNSLNGLSDIQEGTYRYASSKFNYIMVHIWTNEGNE